MGKPGRDAAPSPVNPDDSATRKEVRHDGPPTRSRWGGYHLARPVGPPGAERRPVPAKSNLKRQTSSPLLGLGPGVICCGLLLCRMRPVGGETVCVGRGWWFLCVFARGLGGVSCIPSLPCSIPSPSWLPAPYLLVHALVVLPLAAAFGVCVFHNWSCCLCWRLGALGGGACLPSCFCARALFSRFFLPSSPFIPFCLPAASLIACMHPLA